MGADAASPRVSSDPTSCPALAAELERCAGCLPSETRQARLALASCQGGCAPIPTAASVVVPPSMHGLNLGAPIAWAEEACIDGGGAWSSGRCRHGLGPWGLVADWELDTHEGRITRVEMHFSPDRCQGDLAQLELHVAQLVTHTWGNPTYHADGHYAWIPEQGAYWAVLRDDSDGVVRLWVKQQL